MFAFFRELRAWRRRKIGCCIGMTPPTMLCKNSLPRVTWPALDLYPTERFILFCYERWIIPRGGKPDTPEVTHGACMCCRPQHGGAGDGRVSHVSQQDRVLPAVPH